MKKVLLIGILVLAIVASLVTGTLAVYSVSLDEISGDAVAKEFAISQEGDWDFTKPMKIAPTEKINLSFTISNKKGNIVSEVPMDVSFKAGLRAINGKTLIPYLTFKLYDEYDKLLGSFEGGVGEVKYSFYLPLATTETVKAYRMEIEWVAHSDDTLYQGEANGNRVYVQVSASQSVGEHKEDEEIIFNEAGFNGGSGTSSDPYVISTREAFLKMVAIKAGDKYVAALSDTYFKLDADLDLGVIDNNTKLAIKNGVLDGNGHYIKYVSNKPLFSRLDGGTIQNLTIKDYSFEGTASKAYGNTNMSALVECISSENSAVLIKNVVLENCSLKVDSNNYVGGIAARVYAYNPVVFEDCVMRGVKLDVLSTNTKAGLFVGVMRREVDSEEASVLFKNCCAVDYVDGQNVVTNEVHANELVGDRIAFSKVGVIDKKQGITNPNNIFKVWFDGMEESDVKVESGLSYKTSDGVYLYNITRTYGIEHTIAKDTANSEDILLSFTFDEFLNAHKAK